MSEQQPEQPEHRIDDEQLPQDVSPGEDNPLAEGLGDTETAGDLAPGELLQEGKTAEEMSDDAADDTAERSSDDGTSGEV